MVTAKVQWNLVWLFSTLGPSDVPQNLRIYIFSEGAFSNKVVVRGIIKTNAGSCRLPNTPVLVLAGNHSAFSLVTTQRSSTICCGLAISPRVRIQASLRMAAHRKSYFLAPSFDYPANGPVALGNIIQRSLLPRRELLVGASRVLDGASQEPNL